MNKNNREWQFRIQNGIGYNSNEIVDIIMVLGECNNNFCTAARRYAERFPIRRHPSNHRTIRRVTERARGVLLANAGATNTKMMLTLCMTILAAIYFDPHISSRQIEKEIGIPRRTTLRILNVLRYHAYHITLVQELRPHHIRMHIKFYEWALRTIANDLNFFRFVLISDEAKFYSDGQLNRHHSHYWSNQNPHWHIPVNHQNRERQGNSQ